ncbi:hypothetical protein LshimejAT787_0906060 [Lyophyllum shimeji]|uniref:Uncharacterized protein n=1 Tax=Lyophyllum shimeji TaxID=47721 RepID=A0A9P3PTG2_LYOSH|nr:hypothetical protein LshimejAT787_0906060 [Lyophyllum shimeji]
MDAITRAATTWEASGSLSFVTEVESKWQIPYDDVPIDRRPLADKQHVKLKALGDARYTPASQDVRTLNIETESDIEVFHRLARGYVFHGKDRPTLCAINARVALQARREHLAQHLAAQPNPLPNCQPPRLSLGLRARRHPQLLLLPGLRRQLFVPASQDKPSHASALGRSPQRTSRSDTPPPSFFAAAGAGRDNADSDLSRRSSISFYRRPSIVSAPVQRCCCASPLSRVAGQQRWTEDEGEGKDTKTTGTNRRLPLHDPLIRLSWPHVSTSAEGVEVGLALAQAEPSWKKSRSRSSTVASLAAASTPAPPAPARSSLVRHDSQSSIRTVTVGGEVSVPAHETSGASRPRRLRRAAAEKAETEVDPAQITDRRIEMVTADEKRYRELAWTALREALERFADEGNIQIATRFVESYIDLLTRRRLHACSAYLRKHCQLEDVRTTTLLDTVIYTSCGRCRKPFMVPANSPITGQVREGIFLLLDCRASSVTCAICRLPVRALLFQCSICSHGGHQACYRRTTRSCPWLIYQGPSSKLRMGNNMSPGSRVPRQHRRRAQLDSQHAEQ